MEGNSSKGKSGQFPSHYITEVFGFFLFFFLFLKNKNKKVKENERYVIALFKYEKRREDELNLEKGEILRIIEMKGNWWVGEALDGKVGKFPNNFVKEIQSFFFFYFKIY